MMAVTVMLVAIGQVILAVRFGRHIMWHHRRGDQ